MVAVALVGACWGAKVGRPGIPLSTPQEKEFFSQPEAVYARSLELLRRVGRNTPNMAVKSGLMLGLGERPDELEAALKDLLAAGCRILTLGQYLQPRKDCLPVARFAPPVEFDAWRKIALGMGFHRVAAGPLVRSSYHTKELDAQQSKSRAVT